MLKKRDRRRPRGLVPWSPSEAVQQDVDNSYAIMAEYVPTYGAMTLRQVLYRQISVYGFPKDGAKRLSNYLTRARRAGMIPWDWMRDDRGVIENPGGWDSADHLISTVEHMVRRYTLRGDIGQPYRTIIWCEAAGIVPMIAGMVDQYGVQVRSKSGFDGAGAKEALARDIAEHHRPTRLLHLGDYDVSGEWIYKALIEDVTAHLGSATGRVLPERVALTEAQINKFNLPTEDRKKNDKGTWADNRTYDGINGDVSIVCQLEALAPPDLERIVVEAILLGWDQGAYETLLRQQERDQALLLRWIEGLK